MPPPSDLPGSGTGDRAAPYLVDTRAALSDRPRLLLVDDEPTVGRMLSHAARQCGYDATITSSPASFRLRYDEVAPDVVLLDLSLGSGDGVELLRFLAEKQCAALVLIVSGFDRRVVESADRLGRALGLRMGGCLTKPILVRELADAIAAGRDVRALEGQGDAHCLGL